MTNKMIKHTGYEGNTTDVKRNTDTLLLQLMLIAAVGFSVYTGIEHIRGTQPPKVIHTTNADGIEWEDVRALDYIIDEALRESEHTGPKPKAQKIMEEHAKRGTWPAVPKVIRNAEWDGEK